MKAQRSGMTRRALAALTVLPLAIAMSGCQLGISKQDEGGGSSPAPAASQSNGTGGSQATSSPQATGTAKPAASGVQGTWEGAINDKNFRVDVNSVVVKNGVTTLTFTVTNTGSTGILFWYVSFGGNNLLSDDVKLADPQNSLVYSPGKAADKSCMCSELDASSLEPGESRTVFTTFKELPEGVGAVTVTIPNVAPFEGIPVTRE